jgi:uncharacterized membrane protein YgdD (TMEM256/DUF423 family)
MAIGLKLTNIPLLAAGILGLTGVALGALGAHALKSTLLERGTLAAWDTAAKYHLVHAVALLAVAPWAHLLPAGGSRLLVWAVRCWCGGVLLFSGSIYWLALGGPRWLGPVTPVGGVAFMAGWLLVALLAFARGRQEG